MKGSEGTSHLRFNRPQNNSLGLGIIKSNLRKKIARMVPCHGVFFSSGIFGCCAEKFPLPGASYIPKNINQINENTSTMIQSFVLFLCVGAPGGRMRKHFFYFEIRVKCLLSSEASALLYTHLPIGITEPLPFLWICRGWLPPPQALAIVGPFVV